MRRMAISASMRMRPRSAASIRHRGRRALELIQRGAVDQLDIGAAVLHRLDDGLTIGPVTILVHGPTNCDGSISGPPDAKYINAARAIAAKIAEPSISQLLWLREAKFDARVC